MTVPRLSSSDGSRGSLATAVFTNGDLNPCLDGDDEFGRERAPRGRQPGGDLGNDIDIKGSGKFSSSTDLECELNINIQRSENVETDECVQ